MEGPKDDLKWFGEGFDGFPKRLPEDCIEYTLHIIDSKLKDAAIRERLREVQRAATELTKRLLKEYIWQRENFRLELVRENGKVGLPSVTHGCRSDTCLVQDSVFYVAGPTMEIRWRMNGS